MPTLGEQGGPPAPFQDDRKESQGESDRRWAGWLLDLLRLISPRYQGKRYEDAVALLIDPILARWPALRKLKAPKKIE